MNQLDANQLVILGEPAETLCPDNGSLPPASLPVSLSDPGAAA